MHRETLERTSQSWVQRHPAVAVAVIAILLAAVGGLIGFIFNNLLNYETKERLSALESQVNNYNRSLQELNGRIQSIDGRVYQLRGQSSPQNLENENLIVENIGQYSIRLIGCFVSDIIIRCRIDITNNGDREEIFLNTNLDGEGCENQPPYHRATYVTTISGDRIYASSISTSQTSVDRRFINTEISQRESVEFTISFDSSNYEYYSIESMHIHIQNLSSSLDSGVEFNQIPTR